MVGWITTSLIFCGWTWLAIAPMDPAETSRHATREDPSRFASSVLLIIASLAALIGVGVMLIAGLGTRVAALLLVGVMAVAIYTAKLPELHGLVDLANTSEAAYLAAFVWLVVGGAGLASADHLVARWMQRGSHAGSAEGATVP